MTPDQIYTLAQLDAFEPAAYLEQLSIPDTATLDELHAQDTTWLAALASIDAFAARAMKLRLDRALANEPSVPAITRNVFSTTIIQYDQRLDLLAERVFKTAANGGCREPRDVVDLVVDVARDVLALRSTLRTGLLARVRATAAAHVAVADQHARDRSLDDAVRKQWSRARRELEALAANPDAIFAGSFATRMAAHAEQMDEAPAGPEPSFADLIELD
jgi:hypothetical protein